MTRSARRLLVACLLGPLLTTPVGAASGPAVGSRAHDPALDQLTLADRIEYSVDGPFQLDDLEKTVEMTMPALGDLPYETELFAQVVVSNGVPRGHMRAVVARVRDGRRKRLGSVSDRFGPTIVDPPLGSALFFMDLALSEFEAGDILTVTFSFNTNGHQMRRGDEVFINLDWNFLAFTSPAVTARDAFAHPGTNALDKLSVASRRAGSQRGQLHILEEGTLLGELGVELELPIPGSLDGSFAEEMLVFAAAVGGSVGGDEPTGRLRFRLIRYPGDGGRRQILLSRSVKQEEVAIQERVPTPAGFAVGDRIVVEIYFRTDWIVPAGGALVEATAQFLPIHDI